MSDAQGFVRDLILKELQALSQSKVCHKFGIAKNTLKGIIDGSRKTQQRVLVGAVENAYGIEKRDAFIIEYFPDSLDACALRFSLADEGITKQKVPEKYFSVPHQHIFMYACSGGIVETDYLALFPSQKSHLDELVSVGLIFESSGKLKCNFFIIDAIQSLLTSSSRIQALFQFENKMLAGPAFEFCESVNMDSAIKIKKIFAQAYAEAITVAKNGKLPDGIRVTALIASVFFGFKTSSEVTAFREEIEVINSEASS